MPSIIPVPSVKTKERRKGMCMYTHIPLGDDRAMLSRV